MKTIGRIFKFLLKTILVLILVLNLIILFSGRWYLWKGIANTYLVGRSGPSATEYTIFENRRIDAGTSQAWPISGAYNTRTLSPDLEEKFKQIKSHALVIIRNDSILHEQYWDGFSDTSHTNSFSMAKTYVGVLLGCALKDGSIKSLDEPVSTYIPAFKEGAKAKITLRHLVTMTSGIDFNESYANPFAYPAEAYYSTDLMKATLKYDAGSEPGKAFKYLSGNTTLLGYCISAATHKPLAQYLSEKLWKPMGCEHPAYWSLDKKDGVEKAYCCINSNARDFARLGKLALHHGNWNGQQLVDTAYIDEAVKPFPCIDADTGEPNKKYGYSWWVTEYNGLKIFYARGILMQYIICIPEKNMIICRLGRERRPKSNDYCPVDVTYCVQAALQYEK
ncbi:MAG: serine hydrolase [Bacteroidetes bacterium]|nr:serine hydrolase [Bacteroidota bacterium]